MVDISFLIKRLAPLIEKRVKEEYHLFVNSKTEALHLSSSLKEIEKVLEEAEIRRLTDPRVRGWIERLQDVTYEIDDILDEWETKIERRYNDEHQEPCMEKVCLSIQSPCSSLKRVFRRRFIGLNIRDLNEKVDLLAKETVKYSLLPMLTDSQDPQLDTTSTTPFIELFLVIAQSEQVNELVRNLRTSDEQPENDLILFPGQVEDVQIYSLVGLAGVGKTTVAQLVFHELQDVFFLKLWTCVSGCFDGVGVCKAILEALNIHHPKTANFQTLLHQIRSSILGKKFFLVLDDVRIEDDSLWKELQACFRYGAPGSRILVTTRNKKVAKVMGHASPIECVDPLSDAECEYLLERFAFRGREKKYFKKLESITRLLGGKCKGMPLAAKTLGIYLNSTDSEDLWSEASAKELWEFGEMSKSIFTPLASCYKDLPLVLKHCLSYCATFLPSHDIEVNELIRLWRVHGYLVLGGTESDVEIRGQEYVEKLAEHSFFRNCRTDPFSRRFTSVYMHDILHDFAQYLLMNESKAKQLRYINSQKELVPDQHNALKYVRLMILKRCVELPVKIGSMIHLRYLDLKGTSIVKLPASICNLFNLQTLDLQNCSHLSELPEDIHKLRKNLRFLLIEGTDSLKCLPQGIRRLTSIQTLDRFCVGKDFTMLEYLRNLNKLQGSLRVLILADLTKTRDVDKAVHKAVDKAEKAQLKNKRKLSDLTFFIWPEVTKQVMEALEPPSNLLSLCMDGYGASELPHWFSTSLHSLKKLEIKSCSGLLHLPPLGTLSFLEELKIDTMDSLTSVGPEFIGPFPTNTNEAEHLGFPKLKILTFRLCLMLQAWDIDDPEEPAIFIMPLLESLNIESCPRLERLPTRFLNGCHQLRILECPRLSEMLSYRYEIENDAT